VTIEGPAQADIVKKEVHNGVLTIDYLPVIPGEYKVNVKSHGKHINGSPFSAKISGLTTHYLQETDAESFLSHISISYAIMQQ